MSGFSLFGGRKKARIAAIRTELGSVGRQLSAESRALDACEREVRDLREELEASRFLEGLLDWGVSPEDEGLLREMEGSGVEMSYRGLYRAYDAASRASSGLARSYASSGYNDALRHELNLSSERESKVQGAAAAFAQRSPDDVREHTGWLEWRISEEGKKRARHQSEVSRLRERQQTLSAELQQLETR